MHYVIYIVRNDSALIHLTPCHLQVFRYTSAYISVFCTVIRQSRVGCNILAEGVMKRRFHHYVILHMFTIDSRYQIAPLKSVHRIIQRSHPVGSNQPVQTLIPLSRICSFVNYFSVQRSLFTPFHFTRLLLLEAQVARLLNYPPTPRCTMLHLHSAGL